MAAPAKKPERGDRIVHHDEANDAKYIGVVVDVLSSQFTYKVEQVNGSVYRSPYAHNNYIRYCLFTEEWSHVKPTITPDSSGLFGS